MNKTNKRTKFLLSLILCTVLIAAMALCFTGCNDNGGQESPKPSESTATTPSDGTAPDGAATQEVTTDDEAQSSGVIIKGEGNTIFYFDVTDGDGHTQSFEIHTDADIVGDALLEVGLIEGDPGPYGLYVKKVNGITADYEQTGTYWAFYIDNEYGMTGVDLTEIIPGTTYAFKVST